jgi:hypothetical protein
MSQGQDSKSGSVVQGPCSSLLSTIPSIEREEKGRVSEFNTNVKPVKEQFK